jgi:hypothetical protein
MKTVALLALVVAAQATQDVATYSNTPLGLTLTHPKTWQVTTNKKGESKILIPLEGAKEPALLEIYPVGFAAETEIWQISQAAMTKQLRQQMIRQWDETIEEAPILLTKSASSGKGGSKTILTGLVYSNTPKKMMFKLSSAPEEFDRAEFEWRTALQTIRTFDGSGLKAHDPNNRPTKPNPNDKKNQANQPAPRGPLKVNVISDGKNDHKIVKGPTVVKATAAGKEVQLHLPEGWSAQPNEAGAFVLRNPEVAGSVTVTIASSLDSDPPARAFFRASSLSLNDFAKVDKREEPQPGTNGAGANVARVWRVGKSAKGDLFTCDSVGFLGDFYFVMAYRSEDPSKQSADRKAIDALLDGMSVEVAP